MDDRKEKQWKAIAEGLIGICLEYDQNQESVPIHTIIDFLLERHYEDTWMMSFTVKKHPAYEMLLDMPTETLINALYYPIKKDPHWVHFSLVSDKLGEGPEIPKEKRGKIAEVAKCYTDYLLKRMGEP